MSRSPQELAYDDPRLTARARSLAGGGRAILGVTGPPGAGKTSLVEALLGELPPGWAAHVPMDGFHLADVELTRLGRLARKGAPDTFDAWGYAALLRRLRDDGPEVVYAPGFERTLEQPVAGSIPVPPEARLILTEGNYLLLDEPGWRRVRGELDEVWYVDVPTPDRTARLVLRHERFGKSAAEARAWVARVDTPNADLVAATRDRSDLVVTGDRSDPMAPSLSLD
ncbi:MAG: nucleoside/nucleotide kinase family protein [Propionibacteriales bacterium]|nr:nucleoside/nucleotide kinase family protein [Propionibacteriales bacterium]